jgi:sorbitol/mannitol transport system substrate-binding protein
MRLNRMRLGRTRLRRRIGATAIVALSALAGAGCSGAGALVNSSSGTTLTIAIVSNSQMEDAISLSGRFEKEHPNIHLNFVTLPENEARAKITTAVATGSGEFDAVMISNYETPMWARNGWLTDLQPYIARTPGYDPQDFLPTLRKSLSYRGDLYSVPFYGESSFLVYRKDLLRKAGVTMPAHPTWPQVAKIAAKVDQGPGGVRGICLRGDPGWGEVLAPLDTVINTFGGSWFNKDWQPQLTSPPVERAVRFYVNLVREHGEPGAASDGFTECATAYTQGEVAMWYDATSMTSVVEDPATSKVVGKSGYVPAPVVKTKHSGWLYTWSLGIPKTAPDKQAAWDFVSWMTNKKYLKMVGSALGWSHVPPGSRRSAYQLPGYAKVAKPYAKQTLEAIDSANPNRPTVQPVPYTGIQFLDIPEFQDLGTRVSQQISAAIAGTESVPSALQQSQQYAQQVGATYR